ncbi:kinetochore-associated Ndc80 complex subunit nuf2 [Microbotryomycetes sp. JL221]|nr:kinetochore-associated Ndc80 complex subunit nuf2 [Microbotryomycetes sp. JL221]
MHAPTTQPSTHHQAPRFPLAEKLGDLVDVCAELGCSITEHEIQHPTPTKVQQVYEAWMSRMLEINLEDCIRAAKDQLDQIDNYEIYQDSLYTGVFYHTLCQLLSLAQIDDFTIQDLTSPTGQRFYYVLSGLMNFYDFELEEREHSLLPLQKENEELVDKEEHLIKQIQIKKDRIQQEKDKRSKNLPLLEEYKIKEREGNAECLRFASLADNMSKRATEVRSELKKVQEENAALNLEIKNRDIEINRLKSQIVKSPDRLKASIQDMSIQLTRDQEELKILETKERQMKSKIESLIRYEGELATCIKILDEWDVDSTKLAEGTTKYQKHIERYEALLVEQAELENHINLLERRIQNVKEEIGRFDEKTERKRLMGKQRKKQLEEQNVLLLEKKREFEMKAASKNKQAADIEAQIRAIHATTHAELDRGETAFKKIKDQVEVYSLKVNKALDALNTINAQPIDLGA